MCKMIAYSNEWFRGSHYIEESGGHYAFAVYGLLQYIAPYNGKIVTSLDAIREYFCISEDSRAHMKNLKSGIKYLHDKNMIEFYSNPYMKEKIDFDITMIKGKTLLFIRLANMPKNRLTLIKYSEFERILEDIKLNSNTKMELLCYFSAIISYTDVERNVSYPSLNVLNNASKVGRISTCIMYNNMLQDMELIVYDNAGVKVRNDMPSETGEDNGYVSNTYGRPEFKDAVDAYIQQLRNTHRAYHEADHKKKRANTLRSLAKKISNSKKRLEAYTNEDDIKAERANLKSLEAQYRALKDS